MSGREFSGKPKKVGEGSVVMAKNKSVTFFHAKFYGYCLMTNHVHLIIDPGDDPANIGNLMKRLAGRQTRYVNTLERRSGSLWEGRFKSSPIETDAYLLACCRYVELNPVRAGMVERAEDYIWSSYRQKAGLAEANWIDPDPAYLGMGIDKEARALRYTDYVREGVPDDQRQLIRDALQRGQLTGTSRFVEEVEARLGVRVEHRGPGRPRRVEEGSVCYGYK